MPIERKEIEDLGVGLTIDWIRFQVQGVAVLLLFALTWTLADSIFTSRRTTLTVALAVTTVLTIGYFVRRRRRRMADAARPREPHPSVPQLWSAYLQHTGSAPSTPMPHAWHFCDNKRDANECARLVLAGKKRATTPSLWYFETRRLALPKVGDLEIVTNWDGVAQCIIRTTAVDIVRFCDVTAEYAGVEGEGDGSLISWRAVHWGYYRRELRGTDHEPQEDMPLVCQRFEVVFP
jgi:uncharacterized protein YhfF